MRLTKFIFVVMFLEIWVVYSSTNIFFVCRLFKKKTLYLQIFFKVIACSISIRLIKEYVISSVSDYVIE